MQSQCVEIYEDHSGAVYLARGAEMWGLGPVTADMYGQAAADAQGWCHGDWQPNEADGQVPESLADDLKHIATWTRAVLVVERDHYGKPLAGCGGALYLGLEGAR